MPAIGFPPSRDNVDTLCFIAAIVTIACLMRRGEKGFSRGVSAMQVLALYHMKGGVGKTAAAVNLAYLAAQSRGADSAVRPRPARLRPTYYFSRPTQAQGQEKSVCA